MSRPAAPETAQPRRTAVRDRRPATALLGAYAISVIGTRLSMIALPLFVLATTGSATRTGLVAMAETAPYAVSQALTGPVTDRVGARRMSILSDVASAAVVGAVPLLHALGRLNFGLLLVLVAIAGLTRGPGDAAKYVSLPGVAEAAGTPVERVMGLEDGIGRFGSVVGPLGAAALVGALGAPAALAVDAASFAVAAVVVAVGVPRRLAGPQEHDADEGGYLRRLRDGAAVVRRDGLLRSIVGMIAVTNLLDAALSGVLLAVWARQQGGGAGLMGVVAAAMSAGAVIGAATAALVGHRLPRRLTFTVAFFLIGAPRFAVLGLGAPLWLVLAVVFVGGIGAGTINPILGAVEIERIPERARARVLSLITSLAYALIPFGGLLGGLLSDSVGVSAALLAAGVVYLVATTLPALRPEWKEMDQRRNAPTTVTTSSATSAAVTTRRRVRGDTGPA